MSWFCSFCEKSFSRKDNMQRHMFNKHNESTSFTPFRAMPFSPEKCQWKNGLGSISIATSFRDNLPSPEEDRLVLFTMAACVHRNASRHAIY